MSNQLSFFMAPLAPCNMGHMVAGLISGLLGWGSGSANWAQVPADKTRLPILREAGRLHMESVLLHEVIDDHSLTMYNNVM